MRVCECVIALVMLWTAASIAIAAASCACVDLPMTTAPPPIIELVASWDVAQCVHPHRIAVELGDELGQRVSHAAPCSAGTMTLDVPQLGTYRGVIYAWELGSAGSAGAQDAVEVDVDASVTRWDIARVP